MKLILPVETDQNMVAVTFGRAPYFLVYDTETDTQQIQTNPAVSAQGSAGIKAAQFVVDCKADALITARCGLNSANVLKEANIRVYKSNSISVKQTIADFKEGKLAEMESFSSGHHGGR